MKNASPSQVLIVDANADSAEVLHAVFQRKGIETISARQPQKGIQLARSYDPDVIVLDVESLNGEDISTDDFLDSNKEQPARLLLLGNLRQQEKESGSDAILAKPYHFAALIRKIEGLLVDSRAA